MFQNKFVISDLVLATTTVVSDANDLDRAIETTNGDVQEVAIDNATVDATEVETDPAVRNLGHEAETETVAGRSFLAEVPMSNELLLPILKSVTFTVARWPTSPASDASSLSRDSARKSRV
jgi:hypothetical protein